MIDVMKNWLDHYTNKKDIKKKYGEDPLPKRPNSSRKMYDSKKLDKNLEKIDKIFDRKEET